MSQIYLRWQISLSKFSIFYNYKSREVLSKILKLPLQKIEIICSVVGEIFKLHNLIDYQPAYLLHDEHFGDIKLLKLDLDAL